MPKHLTLSNRYCIEELLKLGYQTSQIANKIGYSERAIKKELNRTSINSDYNAEIAQKLYQSRRTSNNHKLSCKVKNLIIALLKKKISPELICGRLKHEGIVNITHKAIYNLISKLKLRHLLFFKARQYKYKKEGDSKQVKIKDRASISERPSSANRKKSLSL
nr:helix-turn-helix domain-containing protein [Francisella noatunensis]